MSSTPNLPFTYLPEGTVRGEVIFNEALNIIDSLMHCYIKGITANPPLNPVDGDRYIVGSSGATGEWTAHENYIASYYSGWILIPPKEGMFVRVFDTQIKGFFLYNGSAWVTAGAIANLTGGIGSSYSQSEVTGIYNKVNTLLDGLRTIGIIRA